MDKIAMDEHGRKVILYLVAWRDSSYFHPHDIQLLKKGDSIKDWYYILYLVLFIYAQYLFN